jgi:hypothetical protein
MQQLCFWCSERYEDEESQAEDSPEAFCSKDCETAYADDISEETEDDLDIGLEEESDYANCTCEMCGGPPYNEEEE